MKKFLSLVLALVMTMSLVTISAGAEDFTDAEDITYAEAVAVISEIGVVNGYDNGEFRPEGGLTRQAAAKIICNLILGPTTAAELNADTNPFPDVDKDSAFAGYIAYCAKEGIIGGYADGTFKGSNPLTGYAFMKMLLGALGYDAEVEQYVGANWSINVAKQAIGIGLNAGLLEDFDGSDFVNREKACLFAFNTLTADMVDYDTTITIGDVTVAGSNEFAVENNARIESIENDDIMQFAEKYFPKLTVKAGADEFERPANTWTYNKTEIGTYVDWSLMVEEYTVGITGKDLTSLLGKSTIEDNYVDYYVDGRESDVIEAENMIKSNTKTYATTGKGVLTQVFFDVDAEQITITSINTYLAEVTNDYDKDDEEVQVDIYANGATVGADTLITLEEVAGIEDYVDGDMILVNVAWNGTDYEIVAAQKAESSVDVDLTKYSVDSYVVTDGTQYDYALTGKQADSLNEIANYGSNALTNFTYILYFDQYGYMIGNEIYEGEDNYLFMTGYDLSGSNLTNKYATANVIFLDGTMATVSVDKDETNTLIGNRYWYKEMLAGGDSEYNKWFTYTTDEVKGETIYTLAPVDRWANIEYAQNGTVNSYNFRATANSIEYGISHNNNVWGNDDSVYITVEADVVSDGTSKGIGEVLATYTGVDDIDLDVLSAATNGLNGVSYAQGGTDNGYSAKNNDASMFVVADDDDYVIGAIILGEDATATDSYAYVLESTQNEWKDADDNEYWEFKAIVDGQVKTLTAKSPKGGYTTLFTKIANQLSLTTSLRTA